MSDHIVKTVADTQAAISVTHAQLKARLERAAHDDTGLSTLEIALWALGLLGAATAAAAVITTAVTTRTGQIR